MSKHETTSPTVSTKAVFLTAIINAYEEREVATADIPGAFLHASINTGTHIHITGKMAEVLIEIEPKLYGPCACYEKGRLVIYTELLKALYGTLMAA